MKILIDFLSRDLYDMIFNDGMYMIFNVGICVILSVAGDYECRIGCFPWFRHLKNVENMSFWTSGAKTL